LVKEKKLVPKGIVGGLPSTKIYRQVLSAKTAFWRAYGIVYYSIKQNTTPKRYPGYWQTEHKSRKD
jgi:hypothetical protein